MLSWEMVWGIIVGLVVSVAGLGGALWVALALTEWATRNARPRDLCLDDEDEIDHRFY